METMNALSTHPLTRIDRRAMFRLGGLTALTGGIAFLGSGAGSASAEGTPDAGEDLPPGKNPYGPDTLRRGSTGKYVKNLQTELTTTWAGEGEGNSGGSYGFYDGDIDGRFGSQTLAAVKAFQRSHEIADDGVVGRVTKRELKIRHGWSPETNPDSLTEYGSVTLRRGSSGQAVSNLQGALNLNGAALGLDATFGRDTESVVKAFQKREGLTVDGRAGLATKEALRITIPDDYDR